MYERVDRGMYNAKFNSWGFSFKNSLGYRTCMQLLSSYVCEHSQVF